MSHPTDRAALMKVITEERQRLEDAIAALTDEQLTTPSLAGGWAPKDLMAHLAYWEASMLDRVRRAAAGEQIARIASTPEEATRVIDERNEQAFQEWRSRSLSDVRAAFAASYRDVLETLHGLSDEQIFGPDGISKGLGYPALDLIAGDTYEHYREHGDTMRALAGR